METRRGSRVGKKSRFTAETRPCGPQRWLPLVVTEFCDVQRKIGRMRPRQDGGAHMLSPKACAELWPEMAKQEEMGVQCGQTVQIFRRTWSLIL